MAKRKRAKRETFWAIKGVHGFYSGTWLTRQGAREGHWLIAHQTNESQEDFWKRRREAYGDRAVKVHLIEAK